LWSPHFLKPVVPACWISLTRSQGTPSFSWTEPLRSAPFRGQSLPSAQRSRVKGSARLRGAAVVGATRRRAPRSEGRANAARRRAPRSEGRANASRASIRRREPVHAGSAPRGHRQPEGLLRARSRGRRLCHRVAGKHGTYHAHRYEFSSVSQPKSLENHPAYDAAFVPMLPRLIWLTRNRQGLGSPGRGRERWGGGRWHGGGVSFCSSRPSRASTCRAR
jgi:hypothetical protein